MNIFNELREINSLIKTAHLMDVVKKETSLALKKSMVLDGKHAESKIAGSKNYDVVVIAKDGENIELLSRRIKTKLPDAEVNKISSDNVLGINGSRRGKL